MEIKSRGIISVLVQTFFSPHYSFTGTFSTLSHFSFCRSSIAIRCIHSWTFIIHDISNTDTSAITKATHADTNLLVSVLLKGDLYCRLCWSVFAVSHSKVQHYQHNYKCLIRQKNNLINEYHQHGTKNIKTFTTCFIQVTGKHTAVRSGRQLSTPSWWKVDMIWQRKDTEWQHVKHTVVWLFQITFSFLH